ncbi:MAG: transglycosylase SLT domain-containing protein [Candidatus Tectomicrobia bacterium]|uniref:Transglycosylase SLT domain-containing protein n=1 Tax=Tectimicrobiota bacterium TaxID=2528274 RepID=A0A933LQH6_UNCTE|nr:transglycosylase SLT domain-containing protein [Candidatus Tectomicrobia bacterium]
MIRSIIFTGLLALLFFNPVNSMGHDAMDYSKLPEERGAPLADIIDLMANKHFKESKARLDSLLQQPNSFPNDDIVLKRAQFLKGYLDYKLHNFSAVIEAFEKSGLNYPILKDYIIYLLGKSHSELKEFDKADHYYGLLTSQKESSFLAIEATFQRAEDLVEKKNYAGALKVYQALNNQFPSSHYVQIIEQKLPDLYEALGDWEQMGEALIALWLHYPDSAVGDEARDRWKRIRDKHKLFHLAPNQDKIFEKTVEANYQKRKYLQTLKHIALFEDEYPKSQYAARLTLMRGVCYYWLKENDLAESELKKFTDPDGIFSKRKDLIPEALNWLTRTYFRMTSDPLKEELFLASSRRAVEKFPSSAWTADIIFRLARYHDVDKHDAKKAFIYYQKIVKNYPKSSLVDDALWWMAWDNYRSKEFEHAIKGFEKIRKSYPEGSFFLSAAYWEAKAHEQLKDQRHAVSLYKVLAQKFPHAYYGQLALERLAYLGQNGATAHSVKKESPPPKVGNFSAASGDGDFGRQFKKIKELIILGLNEYAEKEFALLAKENYDSSSLILEESRFLKHFGKYSHAIRLLLRTSRNSGYLNQNGEGITQEFWETIYPLGYWQEIKKNAEQNGVDPLLIASLIRHESVYDKDVVSHVGAVGLMQVMPTALEKYSQLTGGEKISSSQLFDIRTNIAVGSWLLARELKAFKGELIPSLMSYNAPRERVLKWKETITAQDPEEFIESITFHETRQFTKSVVQIYKEYKRIYGN